MERVSRISRIGCDGEEAAMTDTATLTPELILAAIRECVTVVKPGETLAIRAGEGWTPDQVGQVNEWIESWDLPFRAVMLPGAEFAVATSS